MPDISITSVVAATPRQTSVELGDEATVLHLDSWTYFGLNPVGARVWQLLREPRAVAEIRDALVAEYDVDADRCERDLLALLGDLLANQLIEVRDVAPP
jgi:hypothetical protein